MNVNEIFICSGAMNFVDMFHIISVMTNKTFITLGSGPNVITDRTFITLGSSYYTCAFYMAVLYNVNGCKGPMSPLSLESPFSSLTTLCQN